MDNLNRLSMACPALPLCGLAISEAERGIPDMLLRVRGLLTKLGFAETVRLAALMLRTPAVLLGDLIKPSMADALSLQRAASH